MRSQSYSIIIATKDRESSLSNLFDSIIGLTTKPIEVIVCSSGSDITRLIKQYANYLNLVHVVSSISSQVYQKKLAILNLTKEVEWVAFFDDDVLLKKDSIDEAFDTLKNDVSKDLIAGIGFSFENINLEQTGVLGRIHRNKLGQVLKSGHNVDYMSSKFPIYTQWLNGASMWRFSVLEKYNNELEGLKRSLGEDLIFSYEVSKAHKLIYSPKAKILFQDPLSQYVDLRGKELKLYFHVMLYLVYRNKELSVFRFYIFQITRFLSSSGFKSFSKQISFKEILDFLILYMNSFRIIFSKNKVAFIKRQLNL
jgi:glycosyltransferase involved in cell wall biosynthesis